MPGGINQLFVVLILVVYRIKGIVAAPLCLERTQVKEALQLQFQSLTDHPVDVPGFPVNGARAPLNPVVHIHVKEIDLGLKVVVPHLTQVAEPRFGIQSLLGLQIGIALHAPVAVVKSRDAVAA